MDYDFRSSSAPYAMHRATSSSSTSQSPMYGQSLYPRVGGQSQQPPHSSTVVPSSGRPSAAYHHAPSHSSSSGLGIRVAIKPEYRITPPPHLAPQVREIPRSNFQFDFEFEKKILAEAEKEVQNWSRLSMESLPSRTTDAAPPPGHAGDPIVSKYIASGLSREAVPLAVAHYGDNPTKVQEFVNGYTLLREMGFASSNVAEALVMFDNDTDKALAHFLNSSS